MSQRPNESPEDWYARVSADRDAAAARFSALTEPAQQAGSAQSVDPGSPEQEAAMRRLDELRFEAIEAEAAVINESSRER